MIAGQPGAGRQSLLVSGDRVFFSLQGEGPSLGKPAVFLRLHLCNLRCVWCDTKYTWYYGQRSATQESMPPELGDSVPAEASTPGIRSSGVEASAGTSDAPERWSIERAWETISRHPARRLVITGGEPLLQASALNSLIGLVPANWKVEIETNGTLPPTEPMIERAVQFNVSPKLANSGVEGALRRRPELLRAFHRLPDATFKFVVITKEDLREVEDVVGECGLDADRVIVMPEGVAQRSIARRGRELAAFCQEKGWRLMPRLQVMLWGQRRGV